MHPAPSIFPRAAVVTMALLAFRISRVPIWACAPSVFARVARRCDDILSHPHVSRARVMSARDSCAFDLPSRCCCYDCVACVLNLSCSHLDVCLRRCRPSLASLVVATAPRTLARLSRSCAYGARLLRLRPLFALLVTTTALLAFDVVCVSHLCVRLGRRRSSLVSLVVALTS